MFKLLRDEKKPRGYEHVFCSAVQLVLWYKVLASEKKILQVSTTEDSGDCLTECEKNESVEPRPLLEKENSALHYIREVMNY